MPSGSKSKHKTSNKFCDLNDLTNEASVEQFFVNRLIEELGFSDKQIVPKTSLKVHSVSLGRKKVNYKPDYALKARSKVRVIVDAKAVEESLDAWTGQCAGYCLTLNRGYKNDNPVQFFMLSNGVHTQLYKWDSDSPVLELTFGDFEDGNLKYESLRAMLSPSALAAPPPDQDAETFTLKLKSATELNQDFAWCHSQIHKREGLSYSSAFMEFVKLIFLKLLSDKEVHEKHPGLWNGTHREVEVPSDDVTFSVHWIEKLEAAEPHPMDRIKFQQLLADLEGLIQEGKKKRIFSQNERLELSPETVKVLTQRLESTDLFSIDADLNGRLFETFLSATLRGKDLGQFFTPRSVVKLATGLANLRADADHQDVVLDACCGTGGFLIEALAGMWKAIDDNSTLTGKKKADLKQQVANECLYGVDVAKDPALARIARINMYLHGDGGSSIFQTDVLDKSLADRTGDSAELKKERRELREWIGDGGKVDVVLTNPPFAKEYSRKEADERQLLDAYDLAFTTTGKQRSAKASLRSSVMFFERYYDILKPGGRLVTVIDDSILGSSSYKGFRIWLREHFLVRAVVSLPGDAFQRSRARVKTSVVVLEKKHDKDEIQPSAFMYYCTAVGIDDAPRQRVLPIDRINRKKADKEIETVAQLADAARLGKPEAKKWLVSPDNLQDRLDVKACLPKPSRKVATWKRNGFDVVPVSELLELVYDPESNDFDPAGIIDTATSDETVTHIRVRYDGFCEAGEEIFAADSTYADLYRVSAGHLVVSNINAVHGAVGVVPDNLDQTVATAEYTVCRPRIGMDVRLIWALLRSQEARADLLLLSTGIGRSRVRWDDLAQLRLPIPPDDLASEVVAGVMKAEAREAEAAALRAESTRLLNEELKLVGPQARTILAAFKPPR